MLQEGSVSAAVDVEAVDDDDEVVGVGSLDCPSPTDLKKLIN